MEIPDHGDDRDAPTGPHNICVRLIVTASKSRPNYRIYKGYDDLSVADWTVDGLTRKPFTHIRFPLDGEMSRMPVLVIGMYIRCQRPRDRVS